MGSVRVRSGAGKGKCPSGPGADHLFMYSFLLLAPLAAFRERKREEGKARCGAARPALDGGRPG